jgi:hypothetical protein
MSDMQQGYQQPQVNYAPKHQQQPVIVRPSPTIPPVKFIIGGVIVLLIIVAAVVGHGIASGSSIAVGDCVVTSPNALTQWDIKKVACNSDPGSAPMVQKVVSVQDGSDGQCGFGLTTFRDDPASKTYCLSDYSFGSGG